MKTLTIKQPWAGLIIDGQKDVENRGRCTHHRGSLVIHSARQLDTSEPARRHCPTPCCDLRGWLLGTVDLVDCITDSPSHWADAGAWHWVLTRPQPFPYPLPWRGKLGLFEIPDDVLEIASGRAVPRPLTSARRTRRGDLRCPTCGSLNTIPIVYGMPAGDPDSDPTWDGLHSGGCIIRDEDRYCRACGWQFASGGRARIGGLAAIRL